MFDYIKKGLRITSSAFDDEINSVINACLQELKINGVDFENEEISDIIQLAVLNFSKAHFGNPENRDGFLKVYENLKSYLMNIKRS